MEPERMPQQASPVQQDINSSTEAPLLSLNSQQQGKAMQTSVSEVENRFVKGLREICGDQVQENVSVDDMYHDPTLYPADYSIQRGGARVLQAPIRDENTDYMSLETDEVAGLQDVLKRVQSAKSRTSTTGMSAYSLYGYPFKSKYEFYKACYENGFLDYTSELLEPPIVTLSESEAKDLSGLEKIDGIMDTKEMMREMERMD